jgi:ribosomal protein L44E
MRVSPAQRVEAQLGNTVRPSISKKFKTNKQTNLKNELAYHL